MKEFTLVERTEPFTLKEVIDFIDDEATDISKLDAHELKCRIVDVIQAERNKAIDEFSNKLLTCSNYIFDEDFGYVIPIRDVEDIAEQMKGGADEPQ